MKKIIVMLGMTIAIILSACGGGGSGSTNASDPAEVNSKELLVHNNYDGNYVRSVEADEISKTVYVGDKSSVLIYDMDTDDLIDNISISGDVLNLELNQDKSLLYIGASGSFSIYDVSDRNNIILLDSIITRGANKLYISADETVAFFKDLDGTYLVDISNKNDIYIVYNLGTYLTSFAFSKTKKHLYAIEKRNTMTNIEQDISSDSFTLKIYDVNNPSEPLLLKNFEDFAEVEMKVSNDETKLILALGDVFQIADITDINNIINLYEYSPSDAVALTYGGTFISLSSDDNTFVTTWGEHLKIVDITDLENVKITKATNDFFHLGKTKIIGNLIFVADRRNGAWRFEKSSLTN